MRVTVYNNYVDEEQHNYLVKESSVNFPSVDRLNDPSKIKEVMCGVFHMDKLAEEHLYMIALNNQMVPTGFFLISKGTVNSSLISPREIFIRALLSSAVGIIVIHNHPSGEILPSKKDIEVTKCLVKAGNLLNINVLDHMIIGSGGGFCSLHEQGYI